MAERDEELLGRIRGGDEEAMEELVARWYPRIHAYALRMTGGEQDAQDIAQETFLAVLQHVGRFRFRRKFQSWIFTIAHHKCMDFFRLQGKFRGDPAELERLETADISQRIVDAVVLEQAIAQLPPLQREALVLQSFHGFTISEIANMTHTPPSTVQWRLSAAKNRLAASMEGREHERDHGT